MPRHAGRDAVTPGDNVWIDVDVLMTYDVCGLRKAGRTVEMMQ
jgi:3-isopropylmalate/(R)-2-methylmalate dehydratase large subunit